jgi:hypothetical protein
MKNAVSWDVMPRGSCNNQLFGGTYRLHHQGDKIHSTHLKSASNMITANVDPSSLTTDVEVPSSIPGATSLPENMWL